MTYLKTIRLTLADQIPDGDRPKTKPPRDWGIRENPKDAIAESGLLDGYIPFSRRNKDTKAIAGDDG